MILHPKQEYLDQLNQVLHNSHVLYEDVQEQTAHEEPDYDQSIFDPDIWLAALKYTTRELSAPFIWLLACEDQSSSPIYPYVHSGNAHTDGRVSFNLWEPDFDFWDPKVFHMAVMRVLEHEGVHISQRDRMGHELFASTVPQFKYTEHLRRSEDPIIRAQGVQSYLSDPQEIMAHAKDLANEISFADEPEIVLRDPEGFIDYLPTWKKYRIDGKYNRGEPVLKRLLKYTAAYLVRTK